MSSSPFKSREENAVYDLIGLGFGPSNLALMAAIDEEATAYHGRRLRCLCFDRKPHFAWHPNMLLEGAQIQLSFLKDLVTLRNPQSRYSFLCYLQEKGRLDRFINLRTFYPTRLEFNDYYGWVAAQLEAYVRYSSEILEVEPVLEDGSDETIELLRVVVRDLETDDRRTYLTRNLVVATGGLPWVPDEVTLNGSGRVFHSHEFLGRLQRDFADPQRAWRFAVVGSGQSAAEIFQYLYTNYPNADVTALIRRFAYKPADNSNFVNEIFFPQIEDLLFNLPEDKRQMVITAHRDTNYSCVDLELIEAIYHDLYSAEIVGEDRFRIQPFRELTGISEGEQSACLHLRNVLDETSEELEVDGAVLATGFTRPSIPPQIDRLTPYLELDAQGRPQTDRRWRLLQRAAFHPRVFLQGFCESTHGLSDTLLSTLPSRAQGILETLNVPSTPALASRSELTSAGPALAASGRGRSLPSGA